VCHTDTQTDIKTDRHTMMANTRAEGKLISADQLTTCRRQMQEKYHIDDLLNFCAIFDGRF